MITLRYVVASVILGVLLASATPVYAIDISNPIWKGTSFGGYDLTCNATSTPCSACDAVHVGVNITNALIFLSFPIVSAMILYGAFMMVIAAGSEERFRQGKNIITSAVIGLAIVMSSWVIVNEALHIITGGVDIPWSTITC